MPNCDSHHILKQREIKRMYGSSTANNVATRCVRVHPTLFVMSEKKFKDLGTTNVYETIG